MEFNDNIVKPFDPKEIPNEAFGGEEKVSKKIRSIMGKIILFIFFFSVEKAHEYVEKHIHDERNEIENQKCVFIVLRKD